VIGSHVPPSTHDPRVLARLRPAQCPLSVHYQVLTRLNAHSSKARLLSISDTRWHNLCFTSGRIDCSIIASAQASTAAGENPRTTKVRWAAWTKTK
jgi:hypothetical protein